MRPVIFASLALALGTASLSGYACTTRDEYNQNISQLQANYNGAVGAANKQYADKNIPNVVFVDLSTRSSARRYNDAAFYYAELAQKRANWENWDRSVTTALADYMKESQHAYDNYLRTACLWW
jgi:hypothetical protein